MTNSRSFRFSVATLLWLLLAVAVVAAAIRQGAPDVWVFAPPIVLFTAWLAARSDCWKGSAWSLFAMSWLVALMIETYWVLESYAVLGDPPAIYYQTLQIEAYLGALTPIMLLSIPTYIMVRRTSHGRWTRGERWALAAVLIGFVDVTVSLRFAMWFASYTPMYR
jgi:cation transport ATPase